jgi:hypothetical protein
MGRLGVRGDARAAAAERGGGAVRRDTLDHAALFGDPATPGQQGAGTPAGTSATALPSSLHW